MSEADEIAQNMVATYGMPWAQNRNEMATWLHTHWPDWKDWISSQQCDNIIDGLMAIKRASK